jgi:hypothetical protein
MSHLSTEERERLMENFRRVLAPFTERGIGPGVDPKTACVQMVDGVPTERSRCCNASTQKDLWEVICSNCGASVTPLVEEE